MLLRRLGNKAKIADKIEQYFPKYDLWIEPFFGEGGMFFNKKYQAKHNIVNDIDGDVINLYTVLRDHKEELRKQIALMPIHNDLFQYWCKNKEQDPILQAVRFLFLSNFSFLGTGGCLRFGMFNSKKILLNNIDLTYNKLQFVQFNNTDCIKFLKSIPYNNINDKIRSFIYLDPPYINTVNNYTQGFTQDNVVQLLDFLQDYNVKFAYSEFDNDFIMQQIKLRKLNYVSICERRTLKNRRTEILITNYDIDNNKDLFQNDTLQ